MNFDVLSDSLDIFQNYFLEASAGTGKTFAIEQLVVRLVIEGDHPLSLNQILAVTFTREAAREMKNRIRCNLEKLLTQLKNREASFDYLKAILKGGDLAIKKAVQRVHGALICYDEAQIFTIHGFCHQMLTEFAFEAQVGFEINHPDSDNYQKLLKQSIKDFFLSGLKGKESEEIEPLLKKHRFNMDNLVQKVMKKIESSPNPPEGIFQQIVEECRTRFETLKFKKETSSPDEILKKMEKALEQPAFVEGIRKKYRAVIVDEFQDTDQIQFAIFERLFLSSSHHYVYFVGDPKQSIYGFRNADLYTYLKAAKSFNAQSRAYLDTNFRSSMPLVSALNQLFSLTPQWNYLPKSEELLPFRNVKAGKCETMDIQDGKGCLHFVLAKTSLGRGRNWPTKDLEEKILFPFIANEISRLRSIPYSEMVVLVKDRYQAFRLHAYFQQCAIPSSIKRTLNLADSNAFQALKDLLLALATPQSLKKFKVVLGGMLLRWNKEDLIHEDHPHLTNAQKKFLLLHEIFLKQGFGVFFEKFLTERFGDAEPTVYEKLVAHPDFSLYLDLRQLAEVVIAEESKNQSSLDELIDFLEELAELNPEEEPRLKIREEQENKVAIMTIFASKGLEFETVFALALASRQAPQEEEGDIEERDAEKMRQLYVALTRAKKRVYVPLLFDESRKKVGFGGASPIELFAARWGAPEKKVYEQIPLKPEDVIPFLDHLKNSTSTTWAWENEHSFLRPAPQDTKKITLIPPLASTWSFPENYLVSFSSLSKKEKKMQLPVVLSSEKTIHCLPLGAETGIVLHSIFETIFEKNLQAISAFDKIVSQKIYRTHLEGWEEIVTSKVAQLLQLPLDGFCLADLLEDEFMQEMEFLFPDEQGMVKGFVDLVFRKNGKYYFLDWKSNWLGPTDYDYSQENMRKAMEENDYFLQAEIYFSALKRYVKLFDNRPFTEAFGGAFYIFLRGCAVFHWRQK